MIYFETLAELPIDERIPIDKDDDENPLDPIDEQVQE